MTKLLLWPRRLFIDRRTQRPTGKIEVASRPQKVTDYTDLLDGQLGKRYTTVHLFGQHKDIIDLASSQLALVLNKMIASIEQFEMVVMFCTMLDSHILRNRVREIMKSKLPKWKSKPNKLCRGTL